MGNLIKVDVYKPNEVGVDRLINSYAGLNLFNSPLIIIEFSKYIFNQKNSKIFLNKFLKTYNYQIFNYNKVNINQVVLFTLILNLIL